MRQNCHCCYRKTKKKHKKGINKLSSFNYVNRKSWWKCRNKTAQSRSVSKMCLPCKELLPLVFLYRLCGFHVFSLKGNSSALKYPIIYTTTLIIMNLVLLLYQWINKTIDFYPSGNNEVTKSIDFVQLIAGRVSVTVCLCEAFRKRQLKLKLWTKINEFDRQWTSYRPTDNLQDFYKKITRQQFCWFGTFVLIFVVMVSNVMLIGEYGYILFWMFYTIPYLSCTVYNLEAVFFIKFVTNRLEIYHDLIDVMVVKNKLNETIHKGDALVNEYCWATSRNENIQFLLDTHDHLWEIFKSGNECFGSGILINVVFDFFTSMSQAYGILILIWMVFEGETISVVILVASWCWALPHFITIFMLCTVCNRLEQMVQYNK